MIPPRAFQSRRLSGCGGFSLIEIIAVMAIIALVMATSVSMLPRVLQSSELDKNLSMLSGIMEQARETAISGNTYVWVAFTANGPNTPASTIEVVVLESQDGTDPLNSGTGYFSNAGTASAPVAIGLTNDLVPAAKMLTLMGVQLKRQGAITSVPSLPAITNGSSLQGFGTSSSTNPPVYLTYNGGGTTYTFTEAVEFTPNGEAVVNTSSSWYGAIELGISPASPTPSNDVAVMRLSRLTGRMTVYRP